MMGNVRRRRALDKAQAEGERHVAAVVEKLFDQRFKALKRELRRANLRKRLRKSNGLYKQYDDWNDWIDEFTSQLTGALSYAAMQLNGAEGKFWESNNQQPVMLNGENIVKNYQEHIGRKIVNIGQDTLSGTQQTIADWYNTDASMPQLIDQLQQFYSRDRAEVIARTETGFIRSQVAYENMQAMGITQWIWDAIEDGQSPRSCAFCVSMHGTLHDIEEAMPPDSSHPNCLCGVSYAADNQELVYGEQGINNFPTGNGGAVNLEENPSQEVGDNQIGADISLSGE